MTDHTRKEEKKTNLSSENPEVSDDFFSSASLEIGAIKGQILALKTKQSKLQVAPRTSAVETAEDEFGEVCYKDSLPDEDSELLNMQNDVLKHIFNLTCLFFDEIDETK